MFDFRRIVGRVSLEYPALDSTTPYYEFLSYLECCESLNIKPSVRRFISYNKYYNSLNLNQK